MDLFKTFEPRIKAAHNKLKKLENNGAPIIPKYDLSAVTVSWVVMDFELSCRWDYTASAPTDGLRCFICIDNSGEPGAIFDSYTSDVVLADPTNTNGDLILSNGGFHTFNFHSSTPLVVGTTYWFVVERTGIYDGGQYKIQLGFGPNIQSSPTISTFSYYDGVWNVGGLPNPFDLVIRTLDDRNVSGYSSAGTELVLDGVGGTSAIKFAQPFSVA